MLSEASALSLSESLVQEDDGEGGLCGGDKMGRVGLTEGEVIGNSDLWTVEGCEWHFEDDVKHKESGGHNGEA